MLDARPREAGLDLEGDELEAMRAPAHVAPARAQLPDRPSVSTQPRVVPVIDHVGAQLQLRVARGRVRAWIEERAIGFDAIEN